MGARVHVDFRDFVNTIRRAEKGVYASARDPEIRLAIYRSIANNEELLGELRGPDTGATRASLEAIQDGRDGIDGVAFTSEKTGETRYAYSSLGPEGIWIAPMDAYGRDYGQFSIYNYTSNYDIGYEDGVMEEISEIIKEHIYLGE